ncbi:hypothetical protein B9G69_009405 [Bdellovibrio sp. SKB1291214]|uniref:hypothetical protein n=1 Tax=Bdellovibrio sp. SKB1291214 TaxID=1732569 RepID=UPI000B51D3BA|nr:hypothetical protein [Bdellovibrio sp. SKB1291214]UYL07262.1 hypothetical protein B9G69_009405 [Bdellovibrio sp. SKB1291214]
MFKQTVLTVVSVFAFSQFASAACGDMSKREFKGDQAVTLGYLLKNSSIAKKTFNGDDTTWTIDELHCVQTNRGVLPDLMPAYSCTPPTGVGPITAKSLFDAMSEMGVMPDGTTGHVHETAKEMKCTINKNGTGGTDVNPTCSMVAAWGDECGGT